MTAESAAASQGHLALMLSEAILHVLVERKVIKRSDALEAIDSVAELVAELDDAPADPPAKPARGHRRATAAAREAAGIIEEMRASFAAKS